MNECIFNHCSRKTKARGMCPGHYWQWRNGQELRPLKAYKLYPAPAPGKKICTSCDRVLDAEKDFYLRANNKPQSWCKKCYIAKQTVTNARRKPA